METNKVVRAEVTRVMQRAEQLASGLLAAMTLFTCVVCVRTCNKTKDTQEVINSEDEMAIEQMFDTQAIEAWCKGEGLGTVRMVGA